jgi:soluble lytic murein transglycosylase-like protein
MRTAHGILTAVLALCLSGVCRADIYAFVDADGVTHFTNVPTDQNFALVLAAPPAAGSTSDSEKPDSISPALLARAERYDALIESAARTTEVDSELLRAVIIVESAFDERAVSSRGARGLMQLMPLTARHYGARDAFNPDQNIHAGARYLRDLIGRYDNDLELVLAAYNAGEEAVERYGRAIPPFRETRAYVPRVLGAYSSLQRLKAGI